MKSNNAFDAFINAFPKLLSVVPSTVLLYICAVIMGISLGLILAIVKLGRNKVLKLLISVLISFERGTPLLIQIMIVYFGLKAILIKGFGIADASRWNPAYFAFIAYGLNEACFLSETFRGAYLAIEKGQIEAGESIGMTKVKIFNRIILPQGARIALPSMANLLIDLFKAVSLAFSIGVIDIMGKGQGLANATHGVGAVGIYGAVALLFWIICYLLDKLLSLLEWRLSKDIRVLGAGNKSIVK